MLKSTIITIGMLGSLYSTNIHHHIDVIELSKKIVTNIKTQREVTANFKVTAENINRVNNRNNKIIIQTYEDSMDYITSDRFLITMKKQNRQITTSIKGQ